MKIIADTNIWYYLAQDSKLFDQVKGQPISPTFVNIYELARTKNLIEKEEIVREAIRKFFNYKYDVIYPPPFVYLAQLHCDYIYDVEKEFGQILKFTSKIAEGERIKEDQQEQFKKWVDEKNEGLQDATNFLNETAEKIKVNIINKKEHRKQSSINSTADFILKCVDISTKGNCDLKGFDLNNIELLLNTVDTYFKKIELSAMKMKPNDWFDFSIMAYVQPGDKLWTSDKRWINLIEEAGLETYLYKI